MPEPDVSIETCSMQAVKNTNSCRAGTQSVKRNVNRLLTVIDRKMDADHKN